MPGVMSSLTTPSQVGVLRLLQSIHARHCALALSASQQTLHAPQSATVIYGPGYDTGNTAAVVAPVALATVAWRRLLPSAADLV